MISFDASVARNNASFRDASRPARKNVTANEISLDARAPGRAFRDVTRVSAAPAIAPAHRTPRVMSATALAPLAAAPRAAARRAGRSSAAARGPRHLPHGARRRHRHRLRATYGPIGESIEKKIAEELAPEVLVVNDDSEKHANHKGLHDGHAGVRSNESHFSVTVVSEQFAGMTPIKRHRLVNSILQKEFDDGLHALQLSTKTPAEWEKTNK